MLLNRVQECMPIHFVRILAHLFVTVVITLKYVISTHFAYNSIFLLLVANMSQ